MALAIALIAGTEYDVGPDVPFEVLLWTVGFALLGIVLWVAGHTAYADRAAGDLRASWTANVDPAGYRRRRATAAVAGLGTLLAFVGTVLYGVPAFVLSGGVAFTVTAWVGAGRSREYEACERGLRYAETGAVGRRFAPWNRFDGRRETDEAVVLERRWWVDERMAADEVPPAAREAMRRGIDRSAGRS